AADEVLLELETDKATLEVPSPAAGVLSEVLVDAGQDVEVGAVLGRIEEAAAAAHRPREKVPTPEERAPEQAGGRAATAAPAAGLPEAARAAATRLDPAVVPRSGPDGRVTLQDLKAFFEQASRDAVERSGPAVRKLIADHGLDPALIPASGRDGRVTKEDVLRFLESGAAGAASVVGRSPEPAAEPTAKLGERGEERVRMTRLRRTIAARLKEAQNTAAILTTFNEADMSAVIELRKRYREGFEEKYGVRLGFMSFFVKAVVGALREMPQVNASIEGDEVIYKHYYDIGIAVSTDAGLKVPVIRDADRKSFAEIERSVADMAARARDGSLALDEMEGGTFSITNGGVFGSLLSTPILNPPQSAILGLHKIQERAVVIDGQVEVRPMMYLAMSYDHRLIDGRESVTFLVRVKELIESPGRLILDV
ncbi:MAG: 2-oxoglutarate dehydrogenase complex dihydrolipoyllysine-residue succinyltransferase, partial [Gemmatimonadota bacterium]